MAWQRCAPSVLLAKTSGGQYYWPPPATVQNGRVVASKELTAAGRPLSWQYEARVAGPSWFAARCFGEHQPRYTHMAAHNQFAHTNALMVTVGGRRPTSPEDAARFVAEIDALIRYAPNIPTQSLRKRALGEYHKARQYFADQASPNHVREHIAD